ncbi:MAG: hypothetical protein K9W44_12325 [Candidatus Lokiarchaeota archaeon]|nr:hypothetical protein [Candidatus Harpocratesius repetitus]
MIQNLLEFTAVHMQSDIENWLQEVHPGKSPEIVIKKIANPYSMVKGRRLDVTAALFMFKDLSVDEFLKNTELHDLWNVLEGKEIFIEKITDDGETFKAKEDGFVYQYDKETNEFSTLKSTEQIIVTNWLTDARKISVVDPVSNSIVKKILSTNLPDYQTMQENIIGDESLNPNAEYWKDSIQLFTNFNYRYINLIGHEKGFNYKKAGMNDDTLIEIKVGKDIDMSLEQILKELGFENVNGVKDSKIPLGLVKNPKIQMMFLPIKIGEQYYQIFSYPNTQTVKILINNKVESAKTIEGEDTPLYTYINWRKGLFEIRLLSFAFQKIAKNHIAGIRQYYKNKRNAKGWNYNNGLQKIRGKLKNIYKNVPDIAEQLRDLFFDFNALDKDFPKLGDTLKEHFFDESLEGIIIHDDSGTTIGYLDVLLKELFDNDKNHKYWRIASKNIKTDRLIWNKEIINQIEYIIKKIIDISQDAGGYSKQKISVNPGGAADYLTQFLQKRLGYSEYLQYIKKKRLIRVNNLNSATQIHEWELLQVAWLSLASLFHNIDSLRSTLDYLIENNIRKGEKNDEYIEKYLNEKVVDDHHYYVPPSALPDPIIIIGAKKNAFIANFIQFGKAKSELIGSGREVLIFGSMVGQIQNDEDHTIKFFQLSTPISDAIKDIVPTTPSPYSMIIPQFSMDMWDPVNEEYYKTKDSKINNGIERFVMDFLVFENMLNLLGTAGGAVNWRYPGIYGVGMHGVEDTNIEYYTEKARKVWTAFQNGLSMINIFENQRGMDKFTEMMGEKIGGDVTKMVLIELEDGRAFFNLRNLAEFQGSSIRDVVAVLAKWVYEQYTLHSSEHDLKDLNLKKKRFYNDIKLLMKAKSGTRNAYIATWNRIEGIIKAFGVKGETITIKINEEESIEYFVPTLDENGNIQFDSRLDRWYSQIENPVSIFNSNSQLLMLQQCFAYYLKYKNEMRLYYEEYADESAMNSFDAYLDAIEGFIG